MNSSHASIWNGYVLALLEKGITDNTMIEKTADFLTEAWIKRFEHLTTEPVDASAIPGTAREGMVPSVTTPNVQRHRPHIISSPLPETRAASKTVTRFTKDQLAEYKANKVKEDEEALKKGAPIQSAEPAARLLTQEAGSTTGGLCLNAKDTEPHQGTQCIKREGHSGTHENALASWTQTQSTDAQVG